ncbi:hypothetical protein, partial [Granulicella arctica]|uniref:hypothetical protein n=1 Tax=Granulicella arctica TaxID=940613 RepID=UPI001C53771F
LTPYEYLCKIWTQTPDKFTLNPIHQMPGLNSYAPLKMTAFEGSGEQQGRRRDASGWGCVL